MRHIRCGKQKHMFLSNTKIHKRFKNLKKNVGKTNGSQCPRKVVKKASLSA